MQLLRSLVAILSRSRFPVCLRPMGLVFACVLCSTGTGGEVLVPRGAEWSYHKGSTEASVPADAWRSPAFDAGSWATGASPLRYGDGEGGTVLSDMRQGYSSLFLRREFVVPDASVLETLRINVDYDDGFVVWINGVEVERVNVGPSPTHDSLATAGHECGVREQFVLPDPADYTVTGTNTIAVQGFNIDLDSSDFLIDIELESVRVVKDTKFSVDRGFYEEPIAVAITTETPGASIHYTTDGSAPSETHGTLYTEPLILAGTTVLRAMAFHEGMEPTNVDTQTYLFLDDILQQPPAPPGLPTTWGARDADYAMDPGIVEDPSYRDLLPAALQALPSLSLALDPGDMFGPDGLYHNGGSGDNKPWERATSLELIYADGSEGFQIDCSVRPHSHVVLKRSFKLLFRAEYGPVKLRFPFFESAPLHGDSAVTKLDRLILRAGLNRAWTNRWNPDDTCYTRDQWARDSQIAMSGLGSHGMFVHLYINGLYWGLYNAVERPDAWFTSAYRGGEQEDWYAVNHSGTVSGDRDRFDALRDLAERGGLADPGRYGELESLLDLEQYCDYLILNWYAGTGDWPGNNWYGGNRNHPAGPALFFCWDAEDIFDPLGSGRPGRSNDGAWVRPEFRQGGSSGHILPVIWHAARENPDFLCLFADRVYRHCFHDGALTEESSRTRWLVLNQSIQEAILGESARWGDAREGEGDPLRTPEDDWWPEVERVSSVSIEGNVGRFLDALRDESFYPAIDPPAFSRQGGLVPPGYPLTLESTSGSGDIFFTLDGIDPRPAGGGEVSAEASLYTTPVPIMKEGIVRARVLDQGTWSALGQADFLLPQDFGKLRFTEIMYHPPPVGDVDGDEFEFLELKNTGDTDLSLTGVHFSDGIAFEFPKGARIGAGEYRVLVSNGDAFRLRYPDVEVAGVYERNLSNGGETVTLADPFGDPVASVTYGDDPPWPGQADGDGYSLVTVNGSPVGLENDPAVWQRSASLGGSPGVGETQPLPAFPAITGQPRDVEVIEGEPALFRVYASGGPPPSYRWWFDDQITQTGSRWYFVTQPTTLADNGREVHCVVSNGFGAVTSRSVRLRVLPRPVSRELVAAGADWSYFKGTGEATSPRSLWRSVDFDASTWPSGPSPFGYGDPPWSTALDDMRDAYTTLYLRRRFEVPEGMRITELTLSADFDDGFVAWLNGTEVLRVNVHRGALYFDGLAAGNHESGQLESFRIPRPHSCIRPGGNLLAVQGFNVDPSSSDFKLDVRLSLEGVRLPPGPRNEFIRGDSNGDFTVDLGDVLHLLLRLFLEEAPVECDDARDVDDDGVVSVTDSIVLLDYVILMGAPPPPPFPLPGRDPTEDELICGWNG